jgi:voltage-gated potassium channel
MPSPEDSVTRNITEPTLAIDSSSSPRERAYAVLRRPLRQLVSTVLLLLGLTILGTVGLRLTTGAAWFDCLYMAVITLTTVGYAEAMPLGTAGRLFVIVYLAMSIGVFTFGAFTLGSLLISSQLDQYWRWRRMQNTIERLSGHYIVCGIGRMGNIICEYLHQRGQAFVVIDNDEQRITQICDSRGWISVVGDATDNQTLLAAGIERARSLAAVLPTDSDNVYVVLSARMLASNLQIIARASNQKAVEKLQHAGASRVVSPFTSGAVKMARFMLSPSVEDFLEIADAKGQGLELVEVEVNVDSPYRGKKLTHTDFHEKGVMVIGIRRADGQRLMPPPPDAEIREGDSLFVFGGIESVNELVAHSLSRAAQ